MIALWLLYATVLGLLIGVAGTLVERMLGYWRLPVRLVWAAGIAATLIVPALVLMAPAAPTPPAPAGAGAGSVVAGPATAVALVEPSVPLVERLAGWAGAAAAPLSALDRPLLALWALATLALAATLVRSTVLLRRRRRAWDRREVDGIVVLVAPDTGPAVVGGGPLGVVLPAWALGLDEPLRRLVLRHELEHLRAGDPRLLLAGVAAVVLAPWNLALWWQLGRLRLAVELDCDRRVLREHADVERYGLLLMAVGQRAGGLLRLATPALSEPATTLERRIDAMTARPPRRRLAAATLLVAGAALATAAACVVPSPDRVAGPGEEPVTSRTASRAAADSMAAASGVYFEFQVEEPVSQIPSSGAPQYPAQLRSAGVSGQVIAQFVVDTTGVPEPSTFRVLDSSDEAFTLAVREALPQMRFRPAEVEGRKVKQLVQQPFVFQVAQPLPATSTDTVPGAPPGTAVMSPLRIQGGAGAATAEPLASVMTPLRRERREDTARPASQVRTGPPEQMDANTTFFEFQVEKPATQIPGHGAPTYPATLQAQGIEGQVIAQFVVDTNGAPEPTTFKVLESDHELFTAAVRRAVAEMRFQPAEVGGRKVKQLIQQPFVFAVQK